MAEFQTLDLGRIMHTAELIKGQKRDAESDRLRNAYMGVQTQNAQQAGQHAAAAEARNVTQFTQDQQIQGTKLLNAGAAEVMANPAAAERWFPQLQQAGVLPPNLDWRTIPPDQLQAKAKEYFDSTTAALNAIGITPEARFNAQQRTTAADTQFEREKEVMGIAQGYDLEKIDRQGKYTQERAAAANGRRDFKDSQSLRKEFESLDNVKNFRAVQPIINSAKKAPDTGYGDLDLIYATGKILDPNSVVREGELALTIAAGSPLQRIIGSGRFSIENGGRLTPKSRQQLLQMLEGRVGALREQYDAERTRYSGYAQDNGWDAGSVVGAEQGSAPTQGPTATGPNGEKITLRDGRWVPL